jgi:nicotinamide-nucleotide amidase
MSLEEKLKAILTENHRTIALAESCTGGLIASRITDVAGASDYFEAGVVSYSNKAKERFLGVPEDLLALKGAVSAETAERMAEGVRQAARVDIGLSVTGIAGPGGGSPEKPIGTVFMGLAAEGKTIVRRHQFSGDRRAIKEQTADHALGLLVDFLEGRVVS